MNQAPSDLYYDPAGAGLYDGAERLYLSVRSAKIAGVTRDNVGKFLAGQHAYALYRQARRHYPPNPIYSSGIDRQWQADLADMQAISEKNDRMQYILIVVDVFNTSKRCRYQRRKPRPLLTALSRSYGSPSLDVEIALKPKNELSS